jgi:hypothetical protein
MKTSSDTKVLETLSLIAIATSACSALCFLVFNVLA